MDVLKAVEIAGGGAEALEIDVERLVGHKVCAAGAGKLKAGLYGAVADGSLDVSREDHVAAETGVTAQKDDAGLAEGCVAPFAMEVDGDLTGRRSAAESAFELNGASVADKGVGARGVALNTEVPLLRVGEPEGEVGIGEGDGGLFVVELEIEAGAGGFDVGEAGSGTGFFLRGGRGFNVGGMEEDAFEIPLSCRGVDEVDTGVSEADRGELDAPAPERTDSQGGADGVGANDGLGAECGILVDDEILKGEAGEGEEIQADLVEVNGAAEADADAVCDALLVAIDTDERWEQDEEEENERHDRQVEKAAESVGAERRGNVCVRGFAILVGWIHFLHEFVLIVLRSFGRLRSHSWGLQRQLTTNFI